MKTYIDSLQAMTHKQLVLMLARQKAASEAAIAVTGMAMRFPGHIHDSEQLWQALCAGQVLTGPVPDDRYDPNAPRLAPHHQVLNQGGFVQGIYDFDREFFAMGEDETLYTDPQQRVLLTLAVEALGNANITKAELKTQRVGVFTALSCIEHLYGLLTKNPGSEQLSPYMGTGSALSASAGLLACKLGLNGPSLTVEAACASALVAVHHGIQALRQNDCDIAIIGAAHFLLSPLTTVVFDQANMLSAKGQSRPWDSQADGHVRAEGAAVFILKRKSDAIKNRDHLHGVLKGSAIHQQGQRAQMQASSGVGQLTTINAALANAGVDKAQVCYVEGQGTGSALGGVVEAETLIQAYNLTPERPTPLYLGSAKANFGHMESASGMLSVIKTMLILKHQQVPPQVHFDQPDPRVNWQRHRLAVATRLTPLAPADPKTAIAAVSSFGFTGTCAHLLVEASPPAAANPIVSGPLPFLVSAHSRHSLQQQLVRIRQALIANPTTDIAGLCHTLGICRDHYDYRFALTVTSGEDLLKQLTAYLAQDGTTQTGTSASSGQIVQVSGPAEFTVQLTLVSDIAAAIHQANTFGPSVLLAALWPLAVEVGLIDKRQLTAKATEQLASLQQLAASPVTAQQLLALYNLAGINQIRQGIKPVNKIQIAADSQPNLASIYHQQLPVQTAYEQLIRAIEQQNDPGDRTKTAINVDFAQASLEFGASTRFIIQQFLSSKSLQLGAWFGQQFNKVALPGYVLDSKPYHAAAARFD